MGLTLMSFPRFQALHIKFRTSLNVKRGAEPTTEQLAWDVGVVSRYVSRATCLTQALAGQVLLERYGYPALVHVGVTKEEGKGTFQAHRGPRAMARWLSARIRGRIRATHADGVMGLCSNGILSHQRPVNES